MSVTKKIGPIVLTAMIVLPSVALAKSRSGSRSSSYSSSSRSSSSSRYSSSSSSRNSSSSRYSSSSSSRNSKPSKPTKTPAQLKREREQRAKEAKIREQKAAERAKKAREEKAKREKAAKEAKQREEARKKELKRIKKENAKLKARYYKKKHGFDFDDSTMFLMGYMTDSPLMCMVMGMRGMCFAGVLLSNDGNFGDVSDYGVGATLDDAPTEFMSVAGNMISDCAVDLDPNTEVKDVVNCINKYTETSAQITPEQFCMSDELDALEDFIEDNNNLAGDSCDEIKNAELERQRQARMEAARKAREKAAAEREAKRQELLKQLEEEDKGLFN